MGNLSGLAGPHPPGHSPSLSAGQKRSSSFSGPLGAPRCPPARLRCGPGLGRGSCSGSSRRRRCGRSPRAARSPAASAAWPCQGWAAAAGIADRLSFWSQRERPAGGRATCRLLDAALAQGGGSAQSARMRRRLDASRRGSEKPKARGPAPVALGRRQGSLGRPATWEAVAQALRWSRPSRKLEAEAPNATTKTVPAYGRLGS